MLWEPLAVAALNQTPAQAAAPPFARVLARMFGPGPRDAAIALPNRPLDVVYAEPARRFIEAHRGAVRVRTPATIAVGADGRAAAVAGGERIEAAAVIAAVPWHTIPSLFVPPVPALSAIVSAAAGTAASPIVSVNLWMDRPVLDVPFIGLPGRSMQWVFDTIQLSSGDNPRLALVSSGATALVGRPNPEIIALAVDELTAALPGARQARVLRATVVRERRATFSLAPDQPPRPATETPIHNLLLAGDWIATGLPGTIESAVESGHHAAAVAAAR